jgi:hypothetical protein
MLTSNELFGFMSPALALEILTYTYENDKPLYRATLGAVADARKLRAVFLERQPKPQRHAAMLASLARPSLNVIASNLIRGWLLKQHKGMLVDFLNALGITHEDGVVEQLPPAMEDDKLKVAVDVLLAKYPPEAVAVYLHAFNEMNELEWTNLKSMLDSDPRLQLSGGV